MPPPGISIDSFVRTLLTHTHKRHTHIREAMAHRKKVLFKYIILGDSG